MNPFKMNGIPNNVFKHVAESLICMKKAYFSYIRNLTGAECRDLPHHQNALTDLREYTILKIPIFSSIYFVDCKAYFRSSMIVV